MRYSNSRKTSNILRLLLPILALTILSSCGSKAIGYGVLYWSPDETAVAHGEIFPVLKSSTIAGTHTLEKEGFNEGWTIDSWRLAFFEKEEDAAAAGQAYQPYRHLFAVSQRDRLAVRDKPDPASGRAYVLKLGQVMKIIDKDENPASVGQYEGHWYRVLTEDGVTGYCFDHYLEIYDGREGPQQKISPELAFLKEAFTRVYYPEYFLSMIRNRQIVLDRFSPRFGFFPSLADKRIEIRLPSGSRVFEYETIEVSGSSSFVFSGSGLSVNFFGEKTFAAVFPVEGNNSSERFVSLTEEDISTAIETEKKRREEESLRFAGDGTVYRSSAYGSLEFTEDGGFLWSGKERLVPDVIPAGTGDRGSFIFDHFLGAELSSSYDGVINLRFAGGTRVLFLYTLDESGLKMTTIDPRSVDKNIVQRVSFSPLVMVFARPPE
jgi:hypothetical protein